MGSFQPWKVHIQKKKDKRFSQSQENEARKMIFLENASIYSINSMLAENRSLKN
jgi:hypothetical protein